MWWTKRRNRRRNQRPRNRNKISLPRQRNLRGKLDRDSLAGFFKQTREAVCFDETLGVYRLQEYNLDGPGKEHSSTLAHHPIRIFYSDGNDGGSGLHRQMKGP